MTQEKVRRRERSAPVGRNDDCPCGSGRKFKRCCREGAGRPAASPVAPSARPTPTGGPPPPAPGAADAIVPPLTLVLAFCSIVYELLLGQALSAFLGNTVLRYSVTMGLYLVSMGIGAMLAQARVLARPVVSLQIVELALTVLGAGAVLLLCVADAAGVPGPLFWLLAHGLIVSIGVLSGLEIPLLIELRSRHDPHAASGVLGVDYVGAFLGTVTFAFFFYPRLGLIPTTFVVAALNAAVGLSLGAFRRRVEPSVRPRHRRLLGVQAALLLVLVGCIVAAPSINEFSLDLYLDR